LWFVAQRDKPKPLGFRFEAAGDVPLFGERRLGEMS